MTAPENLCATCEGAGVVVAERPDEPFGLGSVGRRVCPDCGGFGTTPVIPLRGAKNGRSTDA